MLRNQWPGDHRRTILTSRVYDNQHRGNDCPVSTSCTRRATASKRSTPASPYKDVLSISQNHAQKATPWSKSRWQPEKGSLVRGGQRKGVCRLRIELKGHLRTDDPWQTSPHSKDPVIVSLPYTFRPISLCISHPRVSSVNRGKRNQSR